MSNTTAIRFSTAGKPDALRDLNKADDVFRAVWGDTAKATEMLMLVISGESVNFTFKGVDITARLA